VLEERESGTALKSQAVLFRSSSHSAQLELELARRGIPFVKYGGSSSWKPRTSRMCWRC
jgi:Superfamily I DNA and RNA helicases